MHPVTMRRRGRSLLLAVSLTVAVGTVATLSATPAFACQTDDPTCVTVGTGTTPGGGGSGGGSGQDGGSGGSGGKPVVDPCAHISGYDRTLCKAGGGFNAQLWYNACSALYTKNANTMTLTDLNALLVGGGCPAAARAVVPPSPIELAQRALASFKLPLPAGHRSPNETLAYRGSPYTYIHLWTYFWTDSWKTLSATARAGGNYATVSAEPVSLTFTPGNGSALVACDGPGRAWVGSDGNGAPTGGACGYQYSKPTGPGFTNPVTSTQTVTWRLTWTGSGNTSGTFTSRTTSTSGRLNVLQIQVVVR